MKIYLQPAWNGTTYIFIEKDGKWFITICLDRKVPMAFVEAEIQKTLKPEL